MKRNEPGAGQDLAQATVPCRIGASYGWFSIHAAGAVVGPVASMV